MLTIIFAYGDLLYFGVDPYKICYSLRFKIHVHFREIMCVFYNTLNHLLFYSIFSLFIVNI